MEKGENNDINPELRFDLASRDWVIISPKRSKRPKTLNRKEGKNETKINSCPFCNIESQEKPSIIINKGKEVSSFSNWTTIVLPNKYPALLPYLKMETTIEGGIYERMSAKGFHDLVVTKNHKRHVADFSLKEINELFYAYKIRYLSLMKEKYVNHISIFHNHGERAGASISHPHSQIITTPLIDIDILGALDHSRRYYKKNKECLYCKMIRWERKEKKRVIFENNSFIAICPFASKNAFQVIISPKKHSPYFEKISNKDLLSFSEVFSKVMKKIEKGLNKPDYNFYLHNSPCDGKNHDYYHYHWTIIPRSSVYAGFEIGTRMEISPVRPEDAAEFFKKQ